MNKGKRTRCAQDHQQESGVPVCVHEADTQPKQAQTERRVTGTHGVMDGGGGGEGKEGSDDSPLLPQLEAWLTALQQLRPPWQ